MADEDDVGGYEEHEHQGPKSFFEDILERIFGDGSGEPATTMFNGKKERAAFDKAKATAIRVASHLVPPKRQLTTFFAQEFKEKIVIPMKESPFIQAKDAAKLLYAMYDKTGGKVERPGREPADERWGDLIHDMWHEHLCEHVGWDLWVRLRGTPAEKEAFLEEMIPVLEKFGPAILGAFHRFAAPNDEDGNSPFQSASDCAMDSLKPVLAEKAKKLGLSV